jgi:hypothetical protein
MVNPHDVPSARQLVEAVREWLERDVMAATSGRMQFNARVAANVLAIVERELEVSAQQSAAHADRLASFECATDADLARRIREGDLDHRLPEVREAVLASVLDKLAVANPKYVGPEPLGQR